jgi:hypothetical protein
VGNSGEIKKNRIRVSKFFWLRSCCGVEILLGLLVGWLVGLSNWGGILILIVTNKV